MFKAKKGSETELVHRKYVFNKNTSAVSIDFTDYSEINNGSLVNSITYSEAQKCISDVELSDKMYECTIQGVNYIGTVTKK